MLNQNRASAPVPAKNMTAEGDSDWLKVKQWSEYLGSWSDMLPCEHALDPESTPVRFSLDDGALALMINEDVLSIKPDEQQDAIWLAANSRLTTRRGTLFETLSDPAISELAVALPKLRMDQTSLAVFVDISIFIHSKLLSVPLRARSVGNKTLLDLIHFLFPPPPSVGQSFSENAIKDLYSYLKPVATSEPSELIQPRDLKPKLLPFQKKTVAWLLQRECGAVSDTGEVIYKEPNPEEKLPLTWETVHTDFGQELYINRLFGAICLADPDILALQPEPRGGILAEEMGLGKTVEMLALILLNRRPANRISDKSGSPSIGRNETSNPVSNEQSQQSCADAESGDSDMDLDEVQEHRIQSGATIIVTPPSILHQWANEIQSHAPSLRVYIYSESRVELGAEELAQFDVVLTTYSVLAGEFNYVQEYDRPRRFERRYTPRKSPFIQIDWWRVCLDEAQMIEGASISQTASVANMIPRVMSWAVSGTPMRRHIEDLHSLLLFLNIQPLASNKRIWKSLTTPPFRRLLLSSFQRIMHRYAKKDVRHELALPRQYRHVYGIQFTEVEKANYGEKWEQCLADIDVENLGGDDANTDDLQLWLTRLRQTCCHPSVGKWSRVTLGKTNLRTIEEVLDVMVQQSSHQIYSAERTLLVSRIKRGVLATRLQKRDEEVQTFLALEKEVAQKTLFLQAKVDELRLVKLQESGGSGSAPINSEEKQKDPSTNLEMPKDDDDELMVYLGKRVQSGASDKTPDDALGAAIVRHRDWLEQQHRILFFAAGLYHDLEKVEEETKYYQKADDIRQLILALPEKRFNKVLDFVKKVVKNITVDEHFQIPAPTFKGGLTLRVLMEKLVLVTDLLNKHLDILVTWRQDLISRLMQPLMQDGEEGEQYQYSIDLQHTLESYLLFYGKMLLFRKDLVSGTEEGIGQHVANVQSRNKHEKMVKQRVRSFKRKASAIDAPAPEESIDTRLEKEMDDLITPELGSTLRSIRANIKAFVNMGTAPSAELAVAALEDQRLKDTQSHQAKLIYDLEKEVTYFRALTAARTVYYRQLQYVSDSVRDIISLDPQEDIGDCLQEEHAVQLSITRLMAKQRYLEHIASTNVDKSKSSEERLCLICRSQYDLGLMTECGHIFCEHCLIEWTKHARKCPSCNSVISRSKLSRVAMSGTIPTVQNKSAGSNTSEKTVSSTKERELTSVTPISTTHINRVPAAIRCMPIQDGFGSKIDCIVRHISYLVREDSSVKCLVFSQWSTLLSLIGNSLSNNRIEYVRLDGASARTAVKLFNNNPDKHVFMLHAKSQSAGLTLLSATHIFICEPLVNPVLQAQAVSRVHRIGQTKETFVHYYLVNDTVEIPVFNLFERNVAASSGASVHAHDKEYSSTPAQMLQDMHIVEGSDKSSVHGKNRALGDVDDVDEEATVAPATSLEVAMSQNRNGELVTLEDLKYCFQAQLGILRRNATAEALQEALQEVEE
ncbi:hypothetical protein BG004_003901 [Podila humilis]|nr:hypothetical protein BG004_003901 [Podila humilis]